MLTDYIRWTALAVNPIEVNHTCRNSFANTVIRKCIVPLTVVYHSLVVAKEEAPFLDGDAKVTQSIA
jgi:hypothetical protein